MFRVYLVHTPDNSFWSVYFYNRPSDEELGHLCRTLIDGRWVYFDDIEYLTDV